MNYVQQISTLISDFSIMSQLFQALTNGVNLNQNLLVLPASNIQQELMIQFRLTVSLLDTSDWQEI